MKIKNFKKKNVLIYGAGEAGRQLAISLRNNNKFTVLGFLDDKKKLQKKIFLGHKVYSLSELDEIIKIKIVNFIFLAMPSIGRSKRNKIIDKLSNYNLVVKTLPSVSEIVDGKVNISDIKDLNIDDLLNREPVKPNTRLLKKNISKKNVVVTGAGGSIGSELCRQIVKLKPSKLLLLELNEFVLYKIYEELIRYDRNLKIIPLLLDVKNQKKLETIFELFKVHTVYHAAAYKHVPLVEENICAGVENNVFSTLTVAESAVKKFVSNVVLISSDKAVRPTNVMGASKRLSELCIQGISNSLNNVNTKFSIVRFGNVLESSGSVIPKFKRQINEDGIVTLTHKEVTRYFMTLTEAAQLVIQAGAMGKHSEVFVLDMGKSIKIINLIKKMINLSGLTIKNSQNPNGDIQIKIIGLRPGEKLYEELLVGKNPRKTIHPKIQKIKDPFIKYDILKKNLVNLKTLLFEDKIFEVKKLLNQLVRTYKSNSAIVDHAYIEKKLLKKKKITI